MLSTTGQVPPVLTAETDESHLVTSTLHTPSICPALLLLGEALLLSTPPRPYSLSTPPRPYSCSVCSGYFHLPMKRTPGQLTISSSLCSLSHHLPAALRAAPTQARVYPPSVATSVLYNNLPVVQALAHLHLTLVYTGSRTSLPAFYFLSR